MECNSKSAKFWMGLGLGTVLGVVAYYCVKSDKAKEWKAKMGCMAQSAAEKAGEWVTGVKDCNKEKEV